MKYTGFTSKTAENTQFGAGMLVFNLDNPKKFAGDLGSAIIAGATEGGASLTEEIEMLDVYDGLDGYDMPVKEAQKITKRTAKMAFTVKELSKEMLMKAMVAADLVEKGDDPYETIQPRTEIKSTDFAKNMCLLAPMLSTGEPVIVEFDNPMNTNGVNLTVAKDSPGGLELEIQAFGTLEAYEKVPYRIHYPAKNE